MEMDAVEANKRFVAAVEAIYEAAPQPQQWPHALQAIADCFDDAGALLSYGRDDGTFGHVGSAGLVPVIEDFARNFKGDDLRAIRGAERGYYIPQEISTDLDLVSADEMESHPFISC
jgi:hypothetical protein